MRVICPHTNLLRQETVAALMACQGFEVQFRPMVGPHAYWSMFHELWHDRRPFINVEQDMTPTRSQLRALRECPEPFCGYSYRHAGAMTLALGCTKFGAALFDIPLDIPDWWAGERPPRWFEVDGWLGSILPAIHAHDGEVRHLGAGTLPAGHTPRPPMLAGRKVSA